MKIKAPAWLILIALLVVAIWAIWAFRYIEAEDFSSKAVSGTYFLKHAGETSTLVLEADQSFHQELDSAGTTRRAEGTWRISGEGHIAFSSTFLKVTGEELSPGGQAYGQIENWFGLVSITLAPNPDGPKFHKKLFR